MSRKKLNPILITVLIVAVLMVGYGITSVTQKAVVFEEKVFIPAYMRGECSELPESMNQKQIKSHTDEGKWYKCTSEGSSDLGFDTYVPIRNGIECEFTITDSFYSRVYECDIDVDSYKDDKCERIDEKFSGDNMYPIASGKKVWINTDSPATANLYARYPAYGLKVVSSTNYGFPTTINCELTSLSRDYHTIDIEDQKFVSPGTPFNVVTEFREVITSQAVTIKGINNDEPIYIETPNYYYKISEADDGWLFVDKNAGEFRDDKIECIPLSFGCDAEAKVIKLEDQLCSIGDENLALGATSGYAPIEGNSQTLCKYKCSSDNTLKQTTDCITIPDECLEEKPLFDSSKGECVSQKTEEKEEEFNILIPLIIAGIGLVLAMGIVMWRMRRK